MKRALILCAILSLAVSAAASGDGCPTVSFSVKQTFTGYPYYVEDLQTIDYDHDGKLDLVGRLSENGSWGALYTWHGVGDGTFGAAVLLGDTNITDIEVADVNNDGYDDVIAASYGSHFSVWPGKASGGFDTPIITTTNFAVYSVSAGNFNEGNANVDLVASSLTSGLFAVYQGNGNGTFTEVRRVTLDWTDWITDSVAADFDGDGRTDVALSRRMSERVEVYFRNPDDTFAAPVILAAGVWPRRIEKADFNEDGLPDIATVNWDDGTVDVYQNAGSRAFATTLLNMRLPGRWGGTESIRIIDANGDSHLDILAGGVNGDWVTTFIGRGDGGFLSPTWLELPRSVMSLAAGNFDSDSGIEAVAGSYEEMYVLDAGCTPQTRVYTWTPVVSSGYATKFGAVVSGISPATPQPRGNIAFKEGSTILGVVDVDANGKASFTYDGFVSTGPHTLTANFSGNAAVGASSGSTTVTVTNSTSTTSISLGASTHGEPFNSTVSFTGAYSTGYYLLTLDGVTESMPRHNSSPLTLTLNAGAHTISAELVYDFYSPASTSPTYTFTTARHAVTVTKSGDTNLRAGTAHTIQIGVSATTSPAPSGTVTLYRGATQAGSGTLVNGVATITATLPRGMHDCTAVYAGDAYYLTGSIAFKLNVLENLSVAIDAHGFDSNVYIPAVVPQGTTSTAMYRSVHGYNSWVYVPSWSLGSPYDNASGMVRGILYDYRLSATVSGTTYQSNVDPALLYTDASISAGSTPVKISQFTELTDAINALRGIAGLSPFSFDPASFGLGKPILASHIAQLRTAVDQARAQLGMASMTYTDPAPAFIRAVHMQELRDAAR